MFPIMTEEQIKAADEEVLRQRVRELSSASAVLREITVLQQKTVNALVTIAGILVTIEAYLRPVPPVKHRKKKTKKAKR
jgi:hypothetical protein